MPFIPQIVAQAVEVVEQDEVALEQGKLVGVGVGAEGGVVAGELADQVVFGEAVRVGAQDGEQRFGEVDVQSFYWALLQSESDRLLSATAEEQLQNFSLVLFLRQR